MDEIGKSFPAAEAMVDAEQGAKKPVNENCLNCGTKLQDIYCPHCGQKDLPKRQTLGELFSNFISSFWSYEGKFLLTTKYLLTKPGFLAAEYNAGKRERYYHPARMYVFISFVFFLFFFSLPDSDSEDISKPMTEADLKELNKGLQEAGLDSASQDSVRKLFTDLSMDSTHQLVLEKEGNTGFSFTGSKFKNAQAYDSAQKALPIEKRDGWLERKLNLRAAQLNERYQGKSNSFGDDFKEAFLNNFSKVLFYLLPVFALLLKLFYVRRDFFYSEHLVFSIYYYNFFYLAASISLLANQIPWLEWLGTLIGFWIFFYLLFAMKRMYKQSWMKTSLKFALFSFLFMFFLSVGLGISALTIFWII